MKKRILMLIVALSLGITLFCSACDWGNVIENGKPQDPPGTTSPTKPEDPNNPEDPEKPVTNPNDFTVKVFDPNNRPYNPGLDEISVVWRSESGIVRRALGADGTANAGELEGESYSVYLEGLPNKYSYRCGNITATQEERKTEIKLMDVKAPERGNGTTRYEDSAYIMHYDGMYRIEVAKEGKEYWCRYTPTQAGWYSITSWVNVYEDEIDPTVTTYYGDQVGPVREKVTDGGYSLRGGFTKNFRFECQIDRLEVGNPFIFTVTAISKSNTYPINVDFEIYYEGEFSNPDLDVRPYRAKEAKVKAAEKEPDERLVYADLGTKTFDMDNYKYNEDTGFYHRYSMELYGDGSYRYGAGYGPILMCYITKSIPSYSITTLYNANAVGDPQNPMNLLKMYHCWLESEQKYVTLNYEDCIRIDYYKVCNSDGLCYVTQELKEFLDSFANNQSFWTDGYAQNTGTPEANGYFAKRDALWLFACGYYSK
ncbi:MAG: hypothetical protein HDP34_03615 [Clostridia bacterium]|nr:hypothetical protein [Clostridia bacterium]